jgi:hypothetical protein
VAQTPWLASLQDRACARFDAGAPRWPPHLSLVYGRLQPGQREALCEELAGLRVTIDVVAIAVVRTEGPVSDWSHLRRCRLDLTQGPSRSVRRPQ